MHLHHNAQMVLPQPSHATSHAEYQINAPFMTLHPLYALQGSDSQLFDLQDRLHPCYPKPSPYAREIYFREIYPV